MAQSCFLSRIHQRLFELKSKILKWEIWKLTNVLRSLLPLAEAKAPNFKDITFVEPGFKIVPPHLKKQIPTTAGCRHFKLLYSPLPSINNLVSSGSPRVSKLTHIEPSAVAGLLSPIFRAVVTRLVWPTRFRGSYMGWVGIAHPVFLGIQKLSSLKKLSTALILQQVFRSQAILLWWFGRSLKRNWRW